MRGINHLVLAGHDLEAMRAAYQGLGFTVTPRGQHPFGTGNSVIQLHGAYLELLAVTIPHDVPEHSLGHFSFAAFNRDYLARHEGFSMLVFDTPDAKADIAAWRDAGLQTYEPFEFSRSAKMPDGQDVRVGFSLAFVSNPQAPWLGMFACQHYRPDYYEQAQYLQHPNSAHDIRDVWISGDGAQAMAGFMATVTGIEGRKESGGHIVFQTRTGAVVLADPSAFQAAFGAKSLHPQDGPHLAGFTIGCRTLGNLGSHGLARIGNHYVLPASKNFGAALRFTEARQD